MAARLPRGAGRLGGLLLALLLAQLAAMARGQALGLDRKAKEATTKRFLKQLADLNLWAGVVACSDGAGDAIYKDAYGTASFELKAPMSADLRMPTAANENLMVAVALHQLESKGLLNISAPVLSHTSGLWDSSACTTPLDWQAEHCQAARAIAAAAPAANRNPIMVVANWTLGQPLAAKPGEQYSYSDDAYALLSHIVERVSNQSLGDYLKASIFTPANLTGAVFVPGTGGSLVENLVNNPGYVSLFTASAGATPLYVSLNVNGSITANSGFQGFDLSKDAGSVFMTVGDLHDWYRRLFGNPEQLGLTPAAFAEIKQPAVELAGSNYEGQGLSLNVNESSWFYSGNALSWRSYPSIKVKPDGDANASPVCAIISNLSPQVAFADDAARGIFGQQCDTVKSTPQVLKDLATAEPKQVADMTDDERRVALLTHLCYMAYYESVGLTAEEYVRDAVAALIWDARSDDLDAMGLLDRAAEVEAATSGTPSPSPAAQPSPPAQPEPEPSPEPSPKPSSGDKPASKPGKATAVTDSSGGKKKDTGEDKPDSVGPPGTYTDWILDCKGGRVRCWNLVLASMGYQCMNGGGTACCATEKANYCLPANSIDDSLDVGWQGEQPETADTGNGNGNSNRRGNTRKRSTAAGSRRMRR
ncbi:hypothetical protein COHA_004938 [Chlorella ohadii]|uniref:Beta-lactamase-related domain-containing protein n=1 Tax=Chlorella ohadii TaxID=2649997 RepID=A0AAD5DVX4_9CHLO|nr:hypothetical protein COHA_004938 [Chlorella ohadii]